MHARFVHLIPFLRMQVLVSALIVDQELKSTLQTPDVSSVNLVSSQMMMEHANNVLQAISLRV